jgi:hypothetical protein
MVRKPKAEKNATGSIAEGGAGRRNDRISKK